MSRARAALAAILCLAATALAPAAAQAAPAPAWSMAFTPMPANFFPGAEDEYLAVATNVGAGPTTGSSVVEVSLPSGITPAAYQALSSVPAAPIKPTCTIATQAVTCQTAEALPPGRYLFIKVEVDVSATEGALEATATVSGGGAAQTASAVAPTQIQEGPVPFGFLPGFAAPLSNEDGTPTTLAGSHPYQQTVDFGFPTFNPGDGITNDGHPRNFTVELPRGMVGSAAASPLLCTEAQLSEEECPKEAQVGLADVTTLVVAGQPVVFTTPLYNMVPPPGTPVELATDVAQAGVLVHILAGVRSGEDYGVEASVRDVLAFGQQPIFNSQTQLWGDPSAKAHDKVRDQCVFKAVAGDCPASQWQVPLLTMPGDCPGQALPFEALADSWEEPFPEFALRETFYESADLVGTTPVFPEGCGGLEFEPTIEAQPSTNHADSPAGLDFHLHQPQQPPAPEPLSGRATAILRDATVTFPDGLAVNPAQAAGLDACSEDQVGFQGEEEGALHFSKAPQSCPDGAKIGTLKAASPLLPERNAAHEVTLDSQGRPKGEVLNGSLYLAQPFNNPFGSLIAVYLVVEDRKTGIVAKLAGEGKLDPQTGQITTSVRESPEMPIEDIHVHVFGGDRGAFITPQTCGGYSTQADLTPWSAPEGPVAHPTSEFRVSQAPPGGPCPSTQPNNPALSAGTLSPLAGKYSPLTYKLTRADGSERLAKVETTLPAGLSAKLSGVGQCSDADIARAISREEPNRGSQEITDPSCPSQSEVGTVTAGVGAGPSPYYITGHAYLAGPYKGAPLSFVFITPAVAGPFDLGAVVVRAAVYLDPASARARTVSDPLPQLIDGIPADVRSVALHVDRSQFTINPTSCDEEFFEGLAISALGHPAPLKERFQVGGCGSLPYKPKLTARLFGGTNRGAHPRLRAIFTAKPGEANTARVSFALPHSEFIDQAHFRTICTRVQFAAHACPAGSIYGHMKASTPLLDYPLEGPVYLRSSTHELPDVVTALHGPPSQPIELELDGRVDSVHGGVRATFASVPDAPVSKAIIIMQGKRKGLFQNSTDLCRATHRATLRLDGQNGKTYDTRPVLRASCSKKKPKKRK